MNDPTADTSGMAHDTAALQNLATVLSDQREVVTVLLYRIVAHKLMLAADERRFLALSADEVGDTHDLLRDYEANREYAVADLAEAWHVDPDDLTLSRIVEQAPEPFATIFADHRDAFRALTREIEQEQQHCRQLGEVGQQIIADALAAVHQAAASGTYTSDGRYAGDPGRLRYKEAVL